MVHTIYVDEKKMVAREMDGSDYGLTYILDRVTRKVEVLFPMNGKFSFGFTSGGSLAVNDWIVQGDVRLEAGHPWCNSFGMCVVAEYDKSKPFYTKAVRQYCNELIS